MEKVPCQDDEVYADDMLELADDDMAAMEDEFETDSEEDDDWKLHLWSQ